MDTERLLNCNHRNRLDGLAGILPLHRGEPAIGHRPGLDGRFGLVMDILDEAAARLHAKGIDQWMSPHPQAFRDFIAQQLAKGEVYLARTFQDGQAIATIRFEWTDPTLWPDDPDGAGYVHSFAVRDQAVGHSIGTALLQWARDHVHAQHKQFVRLDCWGGNRALCAYYERLGFELRGQLPYKGTFINLYELAVCANRGLQHAVALPDFGIHALPVVTNR